MLWNENPDPITRIFSCINSRNALPRAICAAGFKAAEERELKRGNIGLRVHQLQRDEQAVVESPLRIDASRDIAFVQ